MPRLCRSIILWCATAALGLAGCSLHGQKQITVLVIDDSAAPGTTHGRSPLAAQLVRAATAEGLVALDGQGRISPALADRWIVTDDGQSYIFRLRDGTWPDGSAISSDSVRQALHQAMAAVQHTPLALDLDGIDEVRAMAGRVVEIRLNRAIPDLLQLLAQPELGLTHHARGAGPMALKRSDGALVLNPIPPEKRGLPAIPGWADAARSLVLRGAPGAHAVAAFADSRADIVLGGTFNDLPRTSRTTLGNARPRFDPVSGLFGLAVTRNGASATGLLAEPAKREAIAMAIDRDALAASFALPGWTPTTRVVPPGTADDSGQIDERWVGMSMADRRAAAAPRIRAWTQAHHLPAVLRIALPQGPGADILFDRLTQDMAAISVSLTRVAAGAPADLVLVDEVARYPRGAWFLDALSCSNTEHFACSAAADRFAQQARQSPDAVSTVGFNAQAEATLTQDNVYIPLGQPIRWSLVTGEAPGFAINRWGLHALNALATGEH